MWRIYLSADGRGKADVPNAKLGLGRYTEAGGGVRLGDPSSAGGRINVTEGVETGLGVLGIIGRREPVICGLSASGVSLLVPPAGTTHVRIWPDGDVDKIRMVKGVELVIPSTGLRVAGELQARLGEMGIPSSVQPTPKSGRDYLDVFLKMKERMSNG